MARQGSNFHKCHRCVYRGQPANWEPESPPLAMVTTRDAFEQRDIEVKTIEIPRAVKQPNKHPASVVRGKSAAKNASQAAS